MLHYLTLYLLFFIIKLISEQGKIVYVRRKYEKDFAEHLKLAFCL